MNQDSKIKLKKLFMELWAEAIGVLSALGLVLLYLHWFFVGFAVMFVGVILFLLHDHASGRIVKNKDGDWEMRSGNPK